MTQRPDLPLVKNDEIKVMERVLVWSILKLSATYSLKDENYWNFVEKHILDKSNTDISLLMVPTYHLPTAAMSGKN